MKIKMYVDKKAAILAGKNKIGYQVIEVDVSTLSPEHREILAAQAGSDRDCDVTAIGVEISEATVTNLLIVLDSLIVRAEGIKKRDERKKLEDKLQQETDIAEILLVNPKLYATASTVRLPTIVDGYRRDIRASDHPEFERIIKMARAEHLRLKNESLAREVAEYQRVSAVKIAYNGQLTEAVARLGSGAQQARRAAGLLPDSQVIDLIRSEVYAPLKDWQRYERITDSDVTDNECEVSYSTTDATECSDEQFEASEQIKKLIPSAVVTVRDHVATGDEVEILRKSLLVEVTIGELHLSREYAI